MDAHRFDALTRLLTRPGSRRRVLGTAVGSLVGAGLVSGDAKKKNKVTVCHEGQTIQVAKKAKKKHLKHGDTVGACPPSPPPSASCPGGQKPCDGACIPNNQCCTDGDCPAASPTCCQRECVNMLTDERYCGGCGTGCGFGEQCVSGGCRCGANVACGAGSNCCSGGICGPGSCCVCTYNEMAFFDPVVCNQVAACQAGSTACLATATSCAGTGLSRSCCPAGTTCDEGKCRQ